jgi:hypothetical protein
MLLTPLKKFILLLAIGSTAIATIHAAADNKRQTAAAPEEATQLSERRRVTSAPATLAATEKMDEEMMYNHLQKLSIPNPIPADRIPFYLTPANVPSITQDNWNLYKKILIQSYLGPVETRGNRYIGMYNEHLIDLIKTDTPEVFDFLLNINVISSKTLFFHAVQLGALNGIQHLVAHHGIDIKAKDKCFGWSALHDAVTTIYNWRAVPATIKTLVELGADINARTKFGQTALQHARQLNRPTFVEALLANGAIE